MNYGQRKFDRIKKIQIICVGMVIAVGLFFVVCLLKGYWHTEVIYSILCIDNL